MLKNTDISYGLLTRIFHWVIAYIFIALLIVGTTMINMSDSATKWELYGIHKATGVVTLALVIMRFAWKIINPAVLLPNDLANWLKKIAIANHYFFYLLMFLMPISGIGMSLLGGHDISVFGLIEISAWKQNKELAGLFINIHFYTAWILTISIIGHIIAAFYHHFVRKDNVLMGMIKG